MFKSQTVSPGNDCRETTRKEKDDPSYICSPSSFFSLSSSEEVFLRESWSPLHFMEIMMACNARCSCAIFLLVLLLLLSFEDFRKKLSSTSSSFGWCLTPCPTSHEFHPLRLFPVPLLCLSLSLVFDLKNSFSRNSQFSCCWWCCPDSRQTEKWVRVVLASSSPPDDEPEEDCTSASWFFFIPLLTLLSGSARRRLLDDFSLKGLLFLPVVHDVVSLRRGRRRRETTGIGRYGRRGGISRSNFSTRYTWTWGAHSVHILLNTSRFSSVYILQL